MNLGSIESLIYSWPEIALAATALLLLLIEILPGKKSLVGEVALLGTAVACLAAALQSGGPQGWLFSRMIVIDAFAVFFKIVLALAAFGAVWLSLASKELRGQHPG